MTSIEWLELKLVGLEKDYGIPCKVYDLTEAAKEMHRREIENAHIEGQRVFDDYPHTQWTNDQAELYYEKTYNDKKLHYL